MDYDTAWLRQGMRVLTPEGKELGTIKDVRGGLFQVDVAFAPDYWLRVEDAVRRELEDEEVITRFPYEELRHKMADAPTDVLLT